MLRLLSHRIRSRRWSKPQRKHLKTETNMRLITRQDLANTAAVRWLEQYKRANEEWRTTAYGDTGKIHVALVALGPSPKLSAVNATIGNDSWTRLTCSACRKDASCVIDVDVTS